MKVFLLLALPCLIARVAAYPEDDPLGLTPEVIPYLPTPEFLMPEETTLQAAGVFTSKSEIPNIELATLSIKTQQKKKNYKKKQAPPRNPRTYHKHPRRQNPKPQPQKQPPPRNPRTYHKHPRQQNPKPQPQKQPTKRPGPNFKRRPGSSIGQGRPKKASKPAPQPRPKRCRTQRRVCGSVCRKTHPGNGKCKVQINVPKFCFKNVKTPSVCPGTKPKMCNYVEEEPDICTRTKTTKVQCPDEHYSCDREVTEKVPCPRDDCKKWKKKPCKRRGGHEEKVPCKKPPAKCDDCRGEFYFVKCKKKKWVRREVPCPPSASPSRSPVFTSPSSKPSSAYPPPPSNGYSYNSRPEPSAYPTESTEPTAQSNTRDHTSSKPSPSPFVFPDNGREVSAIRCFASYFDESECVNVSPHCKVADPSAFDEEECTKEACIACIPSRRRWSSTRLKVWCRVFRERYCFAVSARYADVVAKGGNDEANLLGPVGNGQSLGLDLTQSAKTPRRCFKDEYKIVDARCKKTLPSNEVCVNGCRVKSCSKRKGARGFQGYCKNNLPPHCRGGKQKKTCERKRIIKKTCSRPGKENCDSKVTEPYVCTKKKTVKRPCKKQPCKGIFECVKQHIYKTCTQTVKQKYVCGKKKESKATPCKHRGGTRCTPKFCTVKVCN